MVSMLAKNWWVFALRGLVAVVFGILAFVWPELTLLTLVYLFGAYALADGIFGVITGIRSYGENKRWWAVLLGGFVGILAGLLTFLWPGISALILLYFIASWAIITGVFDIVAAIQLRHEITNEWSMGLGGLASVILGALLFVFPGEGALGLVWLIGIYAVIFGVLLIILAFRIRSLPSLPEVDGASRV